MAMKTSSVAQIISGTRAVSYDIDSGVQLPGITPDALTSDDAYDGQFDVQQQSPNLLPSPNILPSVLLFIFVVFLVMGLMAQRHLRRQPVGYREMTRDEKINHAIRAASDNSVSHEQFVDMANQAF
jgi:hypothetical protein